MYLTLTNILTSANGASAYDTLITLGITILKILMIVICFSFSFFLITSVIFYIPLSKAKKMKLEEKEATLNLDKIKLNKDKIKNDNILLADLNLKLKEETIKLKNNILKMKEKNDNLNISTAEKMIEETNEKMGGGLFMEDKKEEKEEEKEKDKQI